MATGAGDRYWGIRGYPASSSMTFCTAICRYSLGRQVPSQPVWSTSTGTRAAVGTTTEPRGRLNSFSGSLVRKSHLSRAGGSSRRRFVPSASGRL
jgi:hypothetical protein